MINLIFMGKQLWSFLNLKMRKKNVSFPLEYLLPLIRPKGRIRRNQLQTLLIFLKKKKIRFLVIRLLL